jgi:Methyltransferase FkbM domain
MENSTINRFRDVICDPLNNFIERHPLSGQIENDNVILHNGIKVPQKCYYDDFSDILILNRGVHEPLEEFVFQECLKKISDSPLMIELGSYWAHYSMWMHLVKPDSETIMFEPGEEALNIGKKNYSINNFSGEFINGYFGRSYDFEKTGVPKFTIDNFLKQRNIKKLDILHSDIQGSEYDMLIDSHYSLSNKIIDYLFISTHSQQLHLSVIDLLNEYGYNVEVSADFNNETTSVDGFIFASSPLSKSIFNQFNPKGLNEIKNLNPHSLFK